MALIEVESSGYWANVCKYRGGLSGHHEGKWGAAIMSLKHSARINDHDPYAQYKDVLEFSGPTDSARNYHGKSW